MDPLLYLLNQSFPGKLLFRKVQCIGIIAIKMPWSKKLKSLKWIENKPLNSTEDGDVNWFDHVCYKTYWLDSWESWSLHKSSHQFNYFCRFWLILSLQITNTMMSVTKECVVVIHLRYCDNWWRHFDLFIYDVMTFVTSWKSSQGYEARLLCYVTSVSQGPVTLRDTLLHVWLLHVEGGGL